MHMMSFWFGPDVGDFLFPGYKITSYWGLIATCFLLSALAIAFEGIKLLQAHLKQKDLIARRRRNRMRVPCPNEGIALISDSSISTLNQTTLWINRIINFSQSLVLWLSQETLTYLLMLAVMLYNVYFLIAVVIGAGIGYFIFGPALIKLNLVNIKVKQESLCIETCGESDVTGLLPAGDLSRSESGSVERACHQRIPSSSVHEATVHCV